MLNLLAYLIIPVYTVLFVRNTNWFTTNFSVIGNLANRNHAFLLWGIIVGIYFYWSLDKIIRGIHNHQKELFLLRSAFLLLAFAVTTPYLPDQLPFHAFLHVVFAFTASILMLLCIFLIVLKLYRTSHRLYKPFLTGLVTITFISALLLIAAGIVSSALEIFFTISFAIFVRRLHIRVLSEEQTLRR